MYSPLACLIRLLQLLAIPGLEFFMILWFLPERVKISLACERLPSDEPSSDKRISNESSVWAIALDKHSTKCGRPSRTGMHRLTDKFFFTLDLVGFKCFKLTKLGIAMSHLAKEKLVSQHPAQICFECLYRINFTNLQRSRLHAITFGLFERDSSQGH